MCENAKNKLLKRKIVSLDDNLQELVDGLQSQDR